MDFTDKVCVITGAAHGIGLCTMHAFARQGAKLAFIDRDRASGEKALSDVKAKGAEALFFCGDIAEEAALESFAGQVIGTYGKIDYLINNACLSRRGILSGCGYEDFNYVLRVGVTAPYMLSRLFLNYFNKGGAIVNISSTRATMSQRDTESYTAAKGGISALTHALAVSLAGKVRVNSVSPGWIDVGGYGSESRGGEADTGDADRHSGADKNQHPARRVGNPLDIARTVMFLCDADSGFITGENITVDGGMTRQMIYHDDHGWKYEG